MSRITTDRPAHLMSGETYAMVADRLGKEEITDAAALTIASWWQSPGTVGRALAELSTTGSVDYDALTHDISATYREAGPADRDALDMLSTWALNHPSRDSHPDDCGYCAAGEPIRHNYEPA